MSRGLQIEDISLNYFEYDMNLTITPLFLNVLHIVIGDLNINFITFVCFKVQTFLRRR